MMTDAPGLDFHHVGVACTAIEDEAERFRPLGYRIDGAAFEDPVQGVRGMFLMGQSPRLELLQPLAGADGGVLAPWLARGAKLYHLAYVADDLSVAIDRFRAQDAKLVVPPVPAVAFDGREIAFLMLRNGVLVELIAKD
jgi:methylmalonyl-CoA/ethylmalonyl-CoA epimerase